MSFSILERIDVGETKFFAEHKAEILTFSILERIDVGETRDLNVGALSVCDFQYPRTDRRG